MSYCYWKRGQTNYIAFHVWDAGAGKTGLVDADFTKLVRKNGLTVAATTGITVSEVDAVNFPGRYSAEVSGASGFVSILGQFEILLYWSSQTSDDGFVANITVTTDGTGAGTWGDALFTAAAADGRVTDGTAALEGATVYIYDAAGNLLFRTSTDANGLWAVAFPEDGTYTIYAENAGYTVGNATVVVSSGVATGPGTDIELTSIGTSTGYTLSELKSYALRQWFDKSDTQAETMATEAINEAVRYIATDRDWPWYNRTITLDFVAPYATGTVAIANGSTTVTLTGGTWPSWAAYGVLIVDGQSYAVASRSSDTVLLLEDAWGTDALTAEGYTLARYSFDLPSGGVYSIKEVLGGNSWPYPLAPIPFRDFSILRDQFPTGGGPASWAIWKNKLAIWPYFTGAKPQRFNLVCKVKPAVLVNNTDEADWDPSNPDILYRAIDLHITYRGQCRAGDTAACRANYQEALRRAAANDRSVGAYDINRRGETASWSSIDLSTRSVTP